MMLKLCFLGFFRFASHINIFFRNKSLKYGFHNKSFILNAPLVSCPIPVIWVGAAANPHKADDLNWATDHRRI